MNRNQTRGAGRQIKGTVKEIAGKATRNRSLQAKGKVEKTVGKVQGKAGDAHARETQRRATGEDER